MGLKPHKKKFNGKDYNYFNTVHSKQSRDNVKKRCKSKGYSFRSLKRGKNYDTYTRKEKKK